MRTAEDWITAYATELGQPVPDADEIAAMLRLASVAAHASERRAAPVACWIAAAAGVPLDEACRRAEALSAQ
jgi:hypothetical protein